MTGRDGASLISTRENAERKAMLGCAPGRDGPKAFASSEIVKWARKLARGEITDLSAWNAHPEVKGQVRSLAGQMTPSGEFRNLGKPADSACGGQGSE